MKVSSNGKTYWFPDSVTITDFIKMTEVSAFRHAWFVLDDLTGEVLKDCVDMEFESFTRLCDENEMYKLLADIFLFDD